MATKEQKEAKRFEIGLWSMIRDVLITSLYRGQFPMAIIGIIVITWLLKMPSADLTKVSFKTLAFFKSYYIGGYLSTILLALSWFYHNKYQQRQFAYEIARIAGERTEWQQKALRIQKLNK